MTSILYHFSINSIYNTFSIDSTRFDLFGAFQTLKKSEPSHSTILSIILPRDDLIYFISSSFGRILSPLLNGIAN